MPVPRPKMTVDTLYDLFSDLQRSITNLRTNPEFPFTNAFSANLVAGTSFTSGSTTFGVTFQDPPLVFTEIQADSAGGPSSLGLTIGNITVTGFDWRIFTTSGANAAGNHNCTVAYVCIGL